MLPVESGLGAPSFLQHQGFSGLTMSTSSQTNWARET